MLRTIFLIFMTSVFLITSFLFYLFNGIHIDNFSISNIKFSQLYLKYDKKLIFLAKELEIKPNNNQSKVLFDTSWIKMTDEVLTYFQTVKIDNIKYKNKTFFMKFEKNKFVLKDDDFSFDSIFKIIDEKVLINSTVKHKDFHIDIKASLEKEDLYYAVDINKITNLQLFKPFSSFDNKTKDLVFDKLSFDFIRINTIKGHLNINHTKQMKLTDFNIEAIVHKPMLIYSQDLTISLDKLLVSLKDNKLVFNSTKSTNTKHLSFGGDIKTTTTSKNITLDGVFLYKDMITKVKSDIKLNALYTFDIKNLYIKNQDLSFLGVVTLNPKDIVSFDKIDLLIEDFEFKFEPKLPALKAKKVYLKYFDNDVVFNLEKPTYDGVALDGSKVILKNVDVTNDTILELDFKTKALLQEKFLHILKFYKVDLPFYQTSGQNKVGVNIQIPFNEQKTTVEVQVESKDTQVKIDGYLVDITSLMVDVDKNNIVKTTLKFNDNSKQNINIEGTMDLHTKIMKGNANIKTFIYDKFIDISDDSFDYTFNFNKNNRILTIPKYSLQYSTNQSKHNISIRDFNKLIPFIENIEVNKNTKQLKTNLIVNSDDNFKNIKIDLHNLNIKLNNSYFDTSPLANSKTKLPITSINLYNGSIEYKSYSLLYGYSYIKSKKSTIDIKLIDDDTTLFFTYNIKTKKVQINSDNISYEFVNRFLDKELLSSGYMILKSEGTFEQLKGKLLIEKTNVQDLLLLNNLIAFINTAPALINPLFILPTLYRLGENNFDMQGYYIKKGWVDFVYSRNSELLRVNDSYTKGNLIDFRTKGAINLETKEIDFIADTIYMKDYSKVLSKIPLIGYISTNKNGNISTQVNIFGTLDKPDFKTSITKNLFKSIEDKASSIFSD